MGLKLVNINKSFGLGIGKPKEQVLKNVNMEINDGEMVAIVGRKGSGKTTLMNIMTGLERPSSGYYLIDGKVMGVGRAFQLAMFRSKKCGIITRKPLLVQDLTLYDNITMPLNHRFMTKKKRLKRAREVLRGLGLKGKGKFYPGDFSVLDQQKICAGRAMIGEPKYIFCDEPTGNLASSDVDRFMDFLEVLNSAGYTIIVFTYSKRVASHCHRMIPVTGEDAPEEEKQNEENLPEKPGHTIVGGGVEQNDAEPTEEDEATSESSPEVHEIKDDGAEQNEGSNEEAAETESADETLTTDEIVDEEPEVEKDLTAEDEELIEEASDSEEDAEPVAKKSGRKSSGRKKKK